MAKLKYKPLDIVPLCTIPKSAAARTYRFHMDNRAWLSIIWHFIGPLRPKWFKGYHDFVKKQMTGLELYLPFNAKEIEAINNTVEQELTLLSGDYFTLAVNLRKEIFQLFKMFSDGEITDLKDFARMLLITIEAEKIVIEMCNHDDPGEQYEDV